ncbi:type II toxin-antitoxin system Phd/YefM family antitoxin [Streptomyces sp.]|uniref:type II toxin-antitoxin system Phd/YefM family antitoxin n=2 Tax=Streptomyces sp. TaxID=1931 RepID=UPI00281207CB|nr:type II toxin-antitoxin system Phd/YefM family antitoxin [Streptomyces sp.]
MTYEIPVTQARAELADLINRVVYGAERVVVTRHGKPLVALVSAADLEKLEGLAGSEAAPEEAEETEERITSTVSRLAPQDSAPGEQRRFGIAAHHRDPGAP